MREYVRDFRMFIGRTAMLTTLCGILAAAVGFLIFLAVWTYTGNEAVKGFCEGFIPMWSMLVPILGYVPCNMVFNYNRAVTPGYKYFHSLPDSARSFRRAVLMGSIYPLPITLVWAVMLWLCSPALSLLMLFMDLTLKGAQNFFGHARSVWMMFIPMMVIVTSMGFIMGFTSSDDDSFLNMDPKIAMPLALAGAAVFVLGTVYSTIVAESKWKREP
ncbi:MAG: hypothetical protein K2O14_01860 [Oscillospiraceae bacterium]|nr:hypothetical protein [Oscillospiraceae bacterium]